MSDDRLLRGRNVARCIIRASREVNDRLKTPIDPMLERQMAQMIKDMADLLGVAVVTIDRMRRAKTIADAKAIGNDFLADLGR